MRDNDENCNIHNILFSDSSTLIITFFFFCLEISGDWQPASTDLKGLPVFCSCKEGKNKLHW